MSKLKVVADTLTEFKDLEIRECFMILGRTKPNVYFKTNYCSSVNAVSLSEGLLVKFNPVDKVMRVTAQLTFSPSTDCFMGSDD